MRCPYCHTLIIHRFNGLYTRMDRKRKARHMRRCDERPNSLEGIVSETSESEEGR